MRSIFKIKITRSIEIVLLHLIFFLDLRFLYFLKQPGFIEAGNNSDNKSYILMLLYVLLIYDLYVDNGKISKRRYSFLFPYIVFQIIISVVIVLYSKIRYSQSWFDMAMCADYLMFPIAAFAFCHMMNTEDKFKRVIRDLVKFVYVALIVNAINGAIFKVTGVTLFKGVNQEGTLKLRGIGLIRSPWSCLIFIATAFVVYEFYEKKYEILSKKEVRKFVAVLAIDVAFFCGTRMTIVALLSTIALMFVMSNKMSSRKKFLGIVFICLILVLSNGVDLLMSSFSLDGAGKASTLARTREIVYYFNTIKDNPLFGMGLVRPKRYELKLVYSGGFSGTPTDVGLLGLLAETGLLGGGMFGCLYLRGVILVVRNYKKKYGLFLFGLMVYITATLPTLIITNVPRVLALPICIAIFETVNYINNKENVKRKNDESIETV